MEGILSQLRWQHVNSKQSFQGVSLDKTPLGIKDGELVTAKVIEVVDNRSAVIEISGKKVLAQLEVPLKPGQEILLQAQGQKEGLINLKLLAIDGGMDMKGGLAPILRQAGLPFTKEIGQMLKALMQEEITLNPKVLKEIFQQWQQSGASKEGLIHLARELKFFNEKLSLLREASIQTDPKNQAKLLETLRLVLLGNNQSSKEGQPTPIKETVTPKDQTMPRETQTLPREIQTLPRETQASPRETQALPRETQALPRETQASPRETQASPRETQASPRESQASPRETQASPRETQALPRETQISPRETPILRGGPVVTKDGVSAGETPYVKEGGLKSEGYNQARQEPAVLRQEPAVTRQEANNSRKESSTPQEELGQETNVSRKESTMARQEPSVIRQEVSSQGIIFSKIDFAKEINLKEVKIATGSQSNTPWFGQLELEPKELKEYIKIWQEITGILKDKILPRPSGIQGTDLAPSREGIEGMSEKKLEGEGRFFFIPLPLSTPEGWRDGGMYFKPPSKEQDGEQKGWHVVFLLETGSFGPLQINLYYQDLDLALHFSCSSSRVMDEIKSGFGHLKGKLKDQGFSLGRISFSWDEEPKPLESPKEKVNLTNLDLTI